MKYKIVQDPFFIWRIVTKEEARILFELGNIQIFILHNDDSESLIENISDIDDHDIYGIELEPIKYLDEKLSYVFNTVNEIPDEILIDILDTIINIRYKQTLKDFVFSCAFENDSVQKFLLEYSLTGYNNDY